MKHENESPDSVSAPLIWGELAAVPKVFPDAAYFAAVARRNAWLVALVLAAGLPIGLFKILSEPKAYTSRTTVVYDPRDASDFVRDYPRFQQIAERLWQFRDSEEVAALAQATEGPEAAPAAKGDSLATRAKAFARSVLRLPPPPAEPPEEARERLIEGRVRQVRERISAYSDESKSALNLAYTAESPEAAQAWAERLMEAFVVRELRAELDRAEALLETFQSLRARDEPAPAKDGDAPGTTDVAALQEREAELLETIQLRRSATTEASSSWLRRRAELEAQLARLRTTLLPSHPEVIAKEEELKDFERSGGGATRTVPKALIEELANVRAKLRKAGAPTRAEAGGGFSQLDERIAAYSVEKLSLERQLANPAKRTRFRAHQAPSFPEEPDASARDAAVKLGLFLVAAALLLVALRETFTPYARDAWRIAALTDSPLLAKIPKALSDRFPGISPQTADSLRRAFAGRGGERTPSGRTLAAHRELIAALKSQGKGRRVLFIGVGDGRRLADFYYSFANVYATDTAESLVLVDCNHLDPVALASPGAGHAGDVCTLLLGESKWAETRVPRAPDKAFDLVPPAAELSDAKARAFRDPQVSRLLESLERAYRMVFVRGLRPSHALENGLFAAAATDVVLCLDATQARREDVRRVAEQLPPDKLRGFVLVAA